MGHFTSNFTIESPPLIAVLAKVQFTPILKIADYIPDFQDVVRRKGFPAFRQKDVKQMKFAPNTPPQQVDQRFWQFTNEQNTQILSIAPDFLTLTVSDYSSFKSFSAPLQLALESIATIVEPSSLVSSGFRSVNVIESVDESPESIWQLLAPGLHGVDHRNLDTSHFHHQYRYWSETPDGNLVVNGRYVHGRDALPPDLRPENLSMKRKFDAKRCVYALELDHNTSRRPRAVPFEVHEIISELDRLHDTVNKGFLSCVTDAARHLWGYREIQ